MLKTLHMYRHKTSIFDDFQYYESKQAEETTTKHDFNHNKRQSSSNRTSATAHLEQQQNEHNLENQ